MTDSSRGFSASSSQAMGALDDYIHSLETRIHQVEREIQRREQERVERQLGVENIARSEPKALLAIDQTIAYRRRDQPSASSRSYQLDFDGETGYSPIQKQQSRFSDDVEERLQESSRRGRFCSLAGITQQIRGGTRPFLSDYEVFRSRLLSDARKQELLDELATYERESLATQGYSVDSSRSSLPSDLFGGIPNARVHASSKQSRPAGSFTDRNSATTGMIRRALFKPATAEGTKNAFTNHHTFANPKKNSHAPFNSDLTWQRKRPPTGQVASAIPENKRHRTSSRRNGRISPATQAAVDIELSEWYQSLIHRPVGGRSATPQTSPAMKDRSRLSLEVRNLLQRHDQDARAAKEQSQNGSQGLGRPGSWEQVEVDKTALGTKKQQDEYLEDVCPSGYSALNVQRSRTKTVKTIQMAMEEDNLCLSLPQIKLRQCLEFFVAGVEEVNSSAQGRRKTINEGQVGVQCKFCAHLPLWVRGPGAVFYPSDLKGVYQSAQSMSVRHLLKHCAVVPPDVQESLKHSRSATDRVRGSKKYWEESCKRLSIGEHNGCLWVQTSTQNDDDDKEVVK